MITPLHIDGLILWDFIRYAGSHDPFLMWGDHGWFCPIGYGGLL
ncbi:hypothetical protein [Pseudomonas abietaniphila]|nr:hypothetical protein [Pseudomonas abietaniphila]